MGRIKFLTIGLLTMLGLSSSVALAQGPSVASFSITPDDTLTTGSFTVTVVFSERMDTTGTYNPQILFGKSDPFADFLMTQSANWADTIRYQATFTITPLTDPVPTPPEDGLYSFSVRHFRNAAGDTLATNPTVPAQQLLIDRSAPVTTHGFDNTVWYNQNVTVNFTASDTAHGDNGAGLRQISYSVNGGDTTVINPPSGTVVQNFSVAVNTEGANNEIRFWSEDILDHRESTNTLSSIKVDKTAPSATVSGLNSLYRTTTFDVPIASSDNLSGIQWIKLYFRKESEGVWTLYANPTPADSLFPGGAPISFEAEDNAVYHFEAVAVDSANNVEPRTGIPEDTTRVDLLRPKLTQMTFIHKDAITDTVCFGTVTIELLFDMDMNTTIAPVVTWGLDEPYTDFNIITSVANWITPRVWQGDFVVTPNIPEAGKDGHYGFRIQGAESDPASPAQGRLMEPTLSFYQNTPVPYDVNDLGIQLLVDRGAPFVAHMPAFDINAWYQQIVFRIDAADTAAPGLRGSGVASITYVLNGVESTFEYDTPMINRSTPQDTIDTEGTNNSLSYYAVDFCGNNGSTTRQVTLDGIKIDRTPPVVNVIAPTPTSSSDLVFPVHYDDSDNTDNLSGVRHVELWYRKDGGGWQQYGGSGTVYTSSPITFNATATGEGEYDFEVVGVDSAGNRQRNAAAEWTTVVAIPRPVVNRLAWIYESDETDTVGVGAVTMQLQFDRAMDTSSEVAISYGLQAPYDTYNVSGQNTQWIDDRTWEGTFTISQSVPECDGLYVFLIQGARADGGNEMAPLSSFDPNGQFQKRLLIDRTPPVTIIRFDSSTYNAATGWWYRGDIQARLIAQDVVTQPGECAGAQGAGVVTFFFQVNDAILSQKSLSSPQVLADTTFRITTEGRNNSVRFWAVDALGYQEDVDADNVIGGIKLDKTAPEATAASPDTSSTLTFNVQWTGLDPAPESGQGPSVSRLSGLKFVELWVRSNVNREWTKLGEYTSSPVSFTGVDDRIYEFEAVAVDSAGNREIRRGIAESQTVVGTPKPLLTRVNFIYSNTVTDTVAKGLTVIELEFNTRMDITVTPTVSYGLEPPYTTYNIPHIGTQWITDRIFQATFTISDDIPATDGRYGFRIADAEAAPDGLGTRMQTTFSTNIDGGRYLLIDRAAPAAPVEPRVSPSGWTNADNISVSWQNPQDLSGVASVWYRIGVPPQSKRDGIQIEKRSVQTLNISTIGLASGTYPVYFWLEDVAGNLDHTKYAMVTFKSDKIPPVFTPTSVPTQANEGQSITLAGTVAEDVGLDLSTSKLYYRLAGESTEIGVDLNISGASVSATIPGSDVTARGLYLRAMLADSAGNFIALPETYVKVSVPGDVPAVTQPGGTTAESYRLISIPLNLASADAASVLVDDLGDPDGGNNWRLLEWDPAANAFKEYPDVSPFTPGKSFFLISKKETPITPGPGESVRADAAYRIAVQQGWNLVAVPFAFAVNNSALSLLSGADVGPVWGFEGEWQTVTRLEPWKGYAVFVSQNDALQVAPTAANGSATKASPRLTFDTGDWSVQITAKKGAARDRMNYFGALRAAETQSADLNWHEPPIISDVTVYFSRDTDNGGRELYATDFRPPVDDGDRWDFIVRSNGSGTVELEFTDVADIPADHQVYLIDAEAGLARDLRKNPRYSYLAGDGIREKTLSVVVGSKSFVQENSLGVPLQPTTYRLFQNYPNPFNPETTLRYELPERATVTLEVYNLLGQRVRTLVDHQALDADFYVAHWDGRNDSGAPVASGVYIAYLRAGSFVASRKMVLMK